MRIPNCIKLPKKEHKSVATGSFPMMQLFSRSIHWGGYHNHQRIQLLDCSSWSMGTPQWWTMNPLQQQLSEGYKMIKKCHWFTPSPPLTSFKPQGSTRCEKLVNKNLPSKVEKLKLQKSRKETKNKHPLADVGGLRGGCWGLFRHFLWNPTRFLRSKGSIFIASPAETLPLYITRQKNINKKSSNDLSYLFLFQQITESSCLAMFFWWKSTEISQKKHLQLLQMFLKFKKHLPVRNWKDS